MPVNLEVETVTRDVLDFSKLVINSQEDLEDALHKVPDYRTRPEKVRTDDLRIDYSDFTFTPTKTELQPETFDFMCPIPPPLNEVKLEDIRSMDINWLMLTAIRPETKQDEDLFNRIVQLERLCYKTAVQEQGQAEKAHYRAAKKGKVKSKIGGKYYGNSVRCPECNDEYCNGICKEFLYEAHERLPPADDDDVKEVQPLSETGEKKVKKKLKKKIVKKKKEGEADVEEQTISKESKASVATRKSKGLSKSEKTERTGVKEKKSKHKIKKTKSELNSERSPTVEKSPSMGAGKTLVKSKPKTNAKIKRGSKKSAVPDTSPRLTNAKKDAPRESDATETK